MSDITPADALRELGDDQAEYAAAAAKKEGPDGGALYWQVRAEQAEVRHEEAQAEVEKQRRRVELHCERAMSAQAEVARLTKVLEEVRAWAEDEYGDSTEVPTGLAMAIYRSVTP